ncbi:N-acetyltransferase family protein [Demequina sp. SYSU T00192]|uniref:N-acetyltransferase family protein n=1 Tax=Demequina litoralis TaxID=3051660 RepID=A0ABT8GA80_9MICO|nr:GNAT family N-acetyltransferase [Demequina sp. SYSU T00192]MDN4476042.1 N-acetyltransferase family protein [Demequina sp. SYSU T00192]
MIRDAVPAADAARIAEIYGHYVTHDTATFETEPVSADDIWARIAGVQDRGLPWIVAETDGRVVGYAYAAPFRDRAAYRHTLETTVYLDADARRAGTGSALYAALLDRLRTLEGSAHAPVHSVMAVIALPHPGSVALHERLGFQHVGTVADAGFKLDRWIDVGYWQLML